MKLYGQLGHSHGGTGRQLLGVEGHVGPKPYGNVNAPVGRAGWSSSVYGRLIAFFVCTVTVSLSLPHSLLYPPLASHPFSLYTLFNQSLLFFIFKFNEFTGENLLFFLPPSPTVAVSACLDAAHRFAVPTRLRLADMRLDPA